MEIANSVGGTPGVPRVNRVMLEGVGARVLRGPDWKWGKQVRIPKFTPYIISFSFMFKIVYFLSRLT